VTEFPTYQQNRRTRFRRELALAIAAVIVGAALWLLIVEHVL
jgi:hypothetical protein